MNISEKRKKIDTFLCVIKNDIVIFEKELKSDTLNVFQKRLFKGIINLLKNYLSLLGEDPNERI